jgi:hypothetical protein
MGSTTVALPPKMARTYKGFWPQRLLCRRRPLQKCRPPARQENPEAQKQDCLEPQTGGSGFPEGSSSLRTTTQLVGTKGWVFH